VQNILHNLVPQFCVVYASESYQLGRPIALQAATLTVLL